MTKIKLKKTFESCATFREEPSAMRTKASPWKHGLAALRRAAAKSGGVNPYHHLHYYHHLHRYYHLHNYHHLHYYHHPPQPPDLFLLALPVEGRGKIERRRFGAVDIADAEGARRLRGREAAASVC